MSSSDWHNALSERKAALFQRLVQLTAGVQPGEENFALALAFCSRLTERHAHADTDQNAVAALYTRLEQRFELASQPAKLASLRALRARLFALPGAGAG
jgi:hypothetical protein